MSLVLAALAGGAREYLTIKKEDRDWMKKFYAKTDDFLNGPGLAALRRNKKDAGEYQQMASRLIQKGVATPGSIMHILNHGKLDGLASVYATVGKRDDITPDAFNDSINYAIAEDASDSNVDFTGAINNYFGLYKGNLTDPVEDKDNSMFARLFGIESPFKREDRDDVDTLLNQPYTGSGQYTGRDIKRIASTDPTLTASFAESQTEDAFTFNQNLFPINYTIPQQMTNDAAIRSNLLNSIRYVHTNVGALRQEDQSPEAIKEYTTWTRQMKNGIANRDHGVMYSAEKLRGQYMNKYPIDGLSFTNSYAKLVTDEIGNPGFITNNRNAGDLIDIYKAERALFDAKLLEQYNIAKDTDPNMPAFNQIGVFNNEKQRSERYKNRDMKYPYAFINGKLERYTK